MIFSERWGRFVVSNRITILAITLLLFGLSIFSIAKNPIGVNNSNEMWFLEGDPTLMAHEKMRDLFGSTEALVVGITARKEDPDLFVAETIMMMEEIHSMLEEHEVVEEVDSLARYQRTYNRDGSVATDDLFEDIEELENNPNILNEAREIMKNEELALDTLISKDLKDARILARTEYIVNGLDHKLKVVSDLRKFVAEKGYAEKGYDLKFGGQPILNERFTVLSNGDAAWLNPTVAVIMMIILAFVFRSVAGVFAPWVVIGTSVTLMTGMQAFLGYNITPVNQTLIPITMLIGMACTVHVLSEFYSLRTVSNLNSKESAVELVKNLLSPIFFTQFTTSVGFAALYVTKLTPVREFSLLATLLPVIVFILSMTALPAALSFLTRLSESTKRAYDNDWLTKLTNWLPKFSFKNRYYIVAIGAGLILFSLYSASYIKVDTNIFSFFRTDLKVAQDLRYFDEKFKGSSNIDIMLDSSMPEGIKEPKFLTSLDALETFLEKQEKAGKVVGYLDQLKQIRKAFSGDNPEFYIVPDSKEMTSQLLLLFANSGPNEDLADLKDFDERYTRLTLPTLNMNASLYNEFLDQMMADIKSNFPSLKVTPTGPMVMFQAQNEYTDKGISQSFMLSLTFISIVLFLIFRSVRHGAIAVLPAVVPIVFAGGCFALAGKDLNLGSLIVGAMTMGIAIDDCIHVVSRYRLARRLGLDIEASISRAMNESGRAVITTSLALVIGFSTFLFARLVPMIDIGWLTMMIFSLALMGCLLFIPALLFIFDEKKTQSEYS
jgi:predicted RND superfamily exporter protein